MNDLLQAALDAVARATGAAVAVRRSLDAAMVHDKSDRSPVTVADFTAQAIVNRLLRERFPALGILAEEEAGVLAATDDDLSGAVVAAVSREFPGIDLRGVLDAVGDRGDGRDAESYWVLDPIDGTKGFIRDAHFAVALGLIRGGVVELGVLGCPRLEVGGAVGCLVWATRGGGAWCRAFDGSPERIRVRPLEDASAARLCEGVESGHSAHGVSARVAESLGLSREPLRMDSQCKYAAVARGDADLYLRVPVNEEYRERIWDHAAGALIVEEAGGRVTGIRGQELDFAAASRLPAATGICAAPRGIHAQVIDAIAEHL